MIKKILIGLLILLIASFALLYLTGHGFIVTSLQRTYLAGHVTANINDVEEFQSNVIKRKESVPLPEHADYNQKPLPQEFLKELKDTNTAAFLVLKDGQLLSETYLSGYHDRSKTNSFSMAKTVTTMLLGIAIKEGYVRDLDQPIVDFLPEFKDDPFGKTATVRQLSLMNSGYEWDEQYYTPFSPTVELYYGSDIRDFLLNREFSAQAGSFWEYSSASTQLLGIFLLRALQKPNAAQSLSAYLSEKIWQPMQMNDDALWHTDEYGMELVYCCINTNARNFARLGLLLQNNGKWNGQQLIPADFVQAMTQPEGQQYYGLSTWLGMHKSPAHYWFSGHLGQYIINLPEHKLTIVRLGEQPLAIGNHMDTPPLYIDAALSLLR